MAKRPLVFQLREKGSFLLTHPVPLSKIGVTAPLGLSGLRDKAKERQLTLPLDSLQDALRKGGGPDGGPDGDDHLGLKHQKVLAELFEFKVGLPHDTRGWPEWTDPLADDDTGPNDRRDTAEKFKKRYLEEHGPPSRDTTEPLEKGTPRKPVSAVDGLASVELSSDQEGDGTANISVLVSCGPTRIDVSSFQIALRKAVLAIDCGMAKAKLASLWGYGEAELDVTGSHGDVRCAFTGNTQRQRWTLDASGSTLGTFELGAEDKAFVERLAHGDLIAATLATWLKYIEPDTQAASSHAAESDIALLDGKGVEAKLDAAKLTVEQQRIIEHLGKRRLDADDNNYAVVASHEIQFVRKR